LSVHFNDFIHGSKDILKQGIHQILFNVLRSSSFGPSLLLFGFVQKFFGILACRTVNFALGCILLLNLFGFLFCD